MNQAQREEQLAETMANREPIIEKCNIFTKQVMIKKEPVMMEKGPCSRIDGTQCAAYIKPAVKWKNGNCPLATHLIYQEDEEKFKNPLKASKQRSRA